MIDYAADPGSVFDLSGETDGPEWGELARLEAASAAEQGLMPGEFTATAYILPDSLGFEDWRRAGYTLQRMERSIRWWIGDWLAYGERAYGETYAQAVEATGRKVQDLMNMAWVAARVEISRRREDLSWSHHAEVAALDSPDQGRLLTEAAESGWSSREIRMAARALGEPRAPETMAAPKCRTCGHPCRWCELDLQAKQRQKGS